MDYEQSLRFYPFGKIASQRICICLLFTMYIIDVFPLGYLVFILIIG